MNAIDGSAPHCSATVCPCGNRFVTIDTKIRGDLRIRYLGCRRCGTKHGKLVIPLRYAPVRQVGFALAKRN